MEKKRPQTNAHRPTKATYTLVDSVRMALAAGGDLAAELRKVLPPEIEVTSINVRLK